MAVPSPRASSRIRKSFLDDSMHLKAKLKKALKKTTKEPLKNKVPIVNSLCESLESLELSPENEISASKIWQTLSTIIKDARKSPTENSLRIGLQLPSSFITMLINWISYSTSANRDNKLTKSIIECGELALQRKLLGNFAFRNFDLLNSLLSASLDLLYFIMESHSESITCLHSFINLILAQYIKFQPSSDELIRTFTLMVSTLLGKSANSIISDSRTEQAFCKKFQHFVNEILINAIYKSTIREDLNQFVLAVLASGTKNVHLQYLVDFLALLQRCDPKIRNAFLVQLFEKNSDINKKSGHYVHFQFLVIICRLFGINEKNDGKCVKLETMLTGNFYDDEDTFAQLAFLLHKYSEIPVEIKSKQTAVLIDPVVYYRGFADFLLNNSNCRSNSWFKCLTLLLSFNSNVLVPTRTLITLEKSLLTGPLELDADSQNAKTELLCAVLEIYSKLKQTNKFVIKFMNAVEKVISDNASTMNLRPSEKFLEVFGNICTDMYMKHALNIWKYLLGEIDRSLGIIDASSPHNTEKILQPAIDFLKTLLRSVNLVGKNVSVTSAQQSYETARISKSLIDKIFHLKPTPPNLLLNSLQLIHSWGELHIMLLSYDNSYTQAWYDAIGVEENNKQTIAKFLECNFYISDNFQHIYKACRKIPEAKLNNAHLLLVVQKLKLLITLGDENNEGWRHELQASFEYMMRLIKFHTEMGFVECWSTTCQSLPGFASWMSPHDVQDVASHIVSTLMETSLEPNGLCEITSLLLRSHEFQDVATFQTAIVTSILDHMVTVLSSLHEEADSGFLSQVTDVLTLVNSNNDGLNMMETRSFKIPNTVRFNEAGSFLEELSRRLGDIFSTINVANDKGKDDLSPYYACLLEALSLLDHLPFEYLLHSNRIRCFVQAMSILIVATEHSGVNINSVKLAGSALKIATSLLNGLQEETNLSDFLSVRELLTWITGPFLIFVNKVQSLNDDSHDIAMNFINLSTDFLSSITSNALVSGGSQFAGFSQFLDEFVSSTSHEPPHDNLVIFALIMLRTLSQRIWDMKLKAKLCFEPVSRLSQCFANWISTYEVSDQTERFDFVCASIEAVGIIFRLESTSIIGVNLLSKEMEIDDVEKANWKKSFLPMFEELLKQVVHNKTPSSRKNFYKAIGYFKECREFLNEAIVRNMWTTLRVIEKPEACSAAKVVDQKLSNSCLDIIIENSTFEEFAWILDSLLTNMVTHVITVKTQRIERSLYEWSAIIKANLGSEKLVLVQKQSQRFLILCQHLLLQMGGKEILAVALMRTQANFLRKNKSPQNLALILQGFSLLDLTKIKNHSQFVRSFDAAHELLRAILVLQTHLVIHAMPAYLAAVQHLLKSIILHGDQDLVKTFPEDAIHDTCNCANKIKGLLVQIAECKGHIVPLAPYLIAFYVTECSNITLYTPVKSSLTAGIFALMSICVNADMEATMMALKESSRELLKVLQNDYEKYHRYTGKV